MDGVLVVDKPVGPTSHDVVARVRQALAQKRIGHTGTLDPAASGVLPLVIGRATRLARFLSGATKTYRATVRLGVTTDTYDAQGVELTRYRGALPCREAVERAAADFTGEIVQRPPLFSAKKIDGIRSYERARKAASAAAAVEAPAPVAVSVYRLDVVEVADDCVELEVECSAGFYVRSLAHDLGERLGVGAHLQALRRTRSGSFTLDDAVALDAVVGHPELAATATLPLRTMLPEYPAVTLNAEGERLAVHGRVLGPAHVEVWPGTTMPDPPSGGVFRLTSQTGELVGLGRPSGPAGLHPFVVLTSDLM